MEAGPPSVRVEELLQHVGWIRGLARALVREPADVDDIVQETWMSALRSPPRDRRNLRGWLAQTLRNVVRSRARGDASRADREQRSQNEPTPTPAELVGRLELERVLAESVASLPEPFRATILLRFYEGLAPIEIARRTGVPDGTVRWRLHEGLARLRTRMHARSGERGDWMLALLPITGPSAIAPSSFAPGSLTVGLLGVALTMKWKLAGALALVLLVLSVAWLVWNPTAPQDAHVVVGAHPISPTQPNDSSLARAEPADVGGREPVIAEDSARAGAIVEGTVVDLAYAPLAWSEQPAANAEVSLSVWDGETRQKRTTRSDSQGHFAIEIPPTRATTLQISVQASEDDLRRSGYESFALEAADVPNPLRIERAAHGVLDIRTEDEHRAPLPGVDLRVPKLTGNVDFVTGPDGSARIEHYRLVPAENYAQNGRFADVTASMEGRRPAAALTPRAIESGGWEPVHISMLRAGGRVVVNVRGPNGEPIPRVSCSLNVAPEELGDRRSRSARPSDTSWREVAAAGDDLGRIEFAEVWRDTKLTLDLVLDERKFHASTHAAGRLLVDGAAGDSVVVGDATLELIFVIPDLFEVRGTVVHADGSPVPGAQVVMKALGRHYPTTSGFTSPLITDEQGMFVRAFDPGPLPLHLRVTAANGPVTNPAPGLFEEPSPRANFSAHGEIELSIATDDARAVPDLRIVLRPTTSIRGRALDTDGAPRGVRVCAVASGRDAEIESRRANIESDGSFAIDGLLPGTYDLVVHFERGSHFGMVVTGVPFVSARFTNIDAGREDVELIVRDPPTVHVTAEARFEGRPAERLWVILGSPSGKAIARRPSRPIERTAVFADHVGWPTPNRVHGAWGLRDEFGQARFLSSIESGGKFTFPPLVEGDYWIGIAASASADPNAPFSYTEATGWVHLEPGEYHFVFDVVPSASLRGRIECEVADRRLCVALADANGALLVLEQGELGLDRVRPAGANGSFGFERVPIGRFELRVGHDDELRAGRSRVREQIEIRANEENVVTIRVPSEASVGTRR